MGLAEIGFCGTKRTKGAEVFAEEVESLSFFLSHLSFKGEFTGVHLTTQMAPG